jgi:hypothetical protein
MAKHERVTVEFAGALQVDFPLLRARASATSLKLPLERLTTPVGNHVRLGEGHEGSFPEL